MTVLSPLELKLIAVLVAGWQSAKAGVTVVATAMDIKHVHTSTARILFFIFSPIKRPLNGGLANGIFANLEMYVADHVNHEIKRAE